MYLLRAFYNKHKLHIWHFAKFQVVGVINFLVDYGVFSLLTLAVGMGSVSANIISYTCGIINSFVLNRYWTFKIKLGFFSLHFVKFVLVNLVSLGINTLAVYILKDLYMLPGFWAKLAATAFSFTVNFAGNKLLVFREQEQDINNK